MSACQKAKVQTFVYTSSTGAVWSGQVVEGATEADVKLVTKEFYPYGYTKALAEDMVIKDNGKEGMRTVAIRPCGMCGWVNRPCFSTSLADQFVVASDVVRGRKVECLGPQRRWKLVSTFIKWGIGLRWSM